MINLYRYAFQRRGTHGNLFPVGVLSAGNRDVWARAKQQLRDLSDENKKSFEVVDSALFVICLDNVQPNNIEELCQVPKYNLNKDTNATPDWPSWNSWSPRKQVRA